MVKNLMKRLNGQEGFTLIELLVVVAIIALLATFAVPKLFDAINKSKGSVGDSDMQTVSSALERHYFDKNAYPLAADVANDLKGFGYVKNGITYKNGFGKGYLYLTDANGAFYVLADVANTPAGDTITFTCNTTKTDTIAVKDTGIATKASTAITAADVAKGCTVSGEASGQKTTVITN